MTITTSAYRNPPKVTATYILVAYFLNWAAEKHPRQFVSNSVIARAIFGRASASNELKVKNAKQDAQVFLLEKFGKGHVIDRKSGVRATVDHNDMVANTYTSQVQRAARASQKASVTASHVKVDKLNPANRKFFVTTKAQFYLESANTNTEKLQRLLLAANGTP